MREGIRLEISEERGQFAANLYNKGKLVEGRTGDTKEEAVRSVKRGLEDLSEDIEDAICHCRRYLGEE